MIESNRYNIVTTLNQSLFGVEVRVVGENVASHLDEDLVGPAWIEVSNDRKSQQQVADCDWVKHAGVENGNRRCHPSVPQAECFVSVGDLLQSREVFVSTLFEREHVDCFEPAVSTDEVRFEVALVDEANNVRARHAKNVGRLLGCQFGIGRNEVHGPSRGEVVQQSPHGPIRLGWEVDLANSDPYAGCVLIDRCDDLPIGFIKVERLDAWIAHTPSKRDKRHKRNYIAQLPSPVVAR